MRRIGILLAAGLLAAAYVSDPAASQAQQSETESASQTSVAQGSWWRTFLPGKGKGQAQARPTQSDQPVVTQNITSENAKAEPAAASATESAVKSTTPPKRVAKKQRRKSTARRSKRRSSESRTASRSSSSKSATKQSSADARWWEETGNPTVFAFAGCVADYAAHSVRNGTEVPHAEYVTKAMAGPCKEPFDKMAGIILEKHGEKGFAKVSKELIESTFIPAVRSAVDKASAELRSQEKRKVALGAEVQNAKDAMFACFVRETDRLAAASTAEARTVGEAVIAACTKEADLFFVKLDELYPDVSDGTQQAALSHSYLPAILTRVASVRAASRAAASQ